jgi:CO/xanthine dehydrogenase FAD-binding subunit
MSASLPPSRTPLRRCGGHERCGRSPIKNRDSGGRRQRHCAGGAGTRFLAGGTTLYDLMKLNVEVPSHIVDINSLSELKAFDTSGSNELVFGALARMSDVAADPRLIRDYPALSESLWRAA